ncbi:alcohol dehydrogenase catalytic domain-containing protein [Amycolatopsis minnesotensis]|uniref:Enoyl reductase (ER) domain-containing protein n=1 Tax=Amycolatopsis minnesotensis TaxID=337894 RepID=A0ABN2R712_9PSEU
MPRTVRPTAFGTPEVLEIVQTPVPRPAVDDKHKDSVGLADSLPSLGLECAGVVTAIGSEVTGVEVGDEVIVYPATGAYADYVTAPVTSLIRKPAGLGWHEAGALMLAGTTAAHALHATGAGEALDTSLALVADRQRIASITGHAPGKLVLVP